MEKIKIWGENIPGNANKPKIDDMVIRKQPKGIASVKWLVDIFGKKVAKDTGNMDTYTYQAEIETGNASKNYDDVPVLTPYVCDESDTAVIIAPGGGFCTQARVDEGSQIAAFLNKHKISAFVLDYRFNPYKAPFGYLDMQRAIRCLRHHAEEYHLSHIGILGFSAGGYIAAASQILLPDLPPAIDNYAIDAIDQESGQADFISLVYPVTDFETNQNMLAMLAGKDFFDVAKRDALKQEYSLAKHLKPAKTPQFICYGTKDPIKGVEQYVEQLNKLATPNHVVRIEHASHGFSLHDPRYAYWGDAYVLWIKEVTK